MRIDERSNAIFPHFNPQGLCGFEIKNRTFTGFSPGGEKGLWCSRVKTEDRALVITETAIDALSYAALKPDPNSRYVSTAGELNQAQPGLLQAAVEKMPRGSRIVLAMDHDEGGRGLLQKIEALLADSCPAECVLIQDRPPGAGDDWNDVLRASVGKTTVPMQPI